MNNMNYTGRSNPKNFEQFLPYKLEVINTKNINTTVYQRTLNKRKVDRIVAEFNERIANEPKLSYRGGQYYVFDGQHTIEARKKLNNGKDLNVVCKVYYDMGEDGEALLFAEQTGVSSKPSPGITLRARSIGNDPETLAFIKANEAVNIKPSYTDARGKYLLRCINTAKKEYKKIGEDQYKEAMKIIVDTWEGKSTSLLSEVVVAMCMFVNTYYGEYNRSKFIRRLKYVDPSDIVHIARTVGEDGGKHRSVEFILAVYNSYNNQDKLDQRF